MHEQATRPNTLGIALNDSPVGLASWILEKFFKWSNASDGRLSTLFSIDDLLTNLMVYWVTGSITSSVRLYREALGAVDGSPMEASSQGGVAVPVGLLCSPVNALGFECMPRDWTGYIYHDVVQYTDLPEVNKRPRPLACPSTRLNPAHSRARGGVLGCVGRPLCRAGTRVLGPVCRGRSRLCPPRARAALPVLALPPRAPTDYIGPNSLRPTTRAL